MSTKNRETQNTRDVYSVSRLNREVKGLLETQLPSLWVEGEISNLARPASGHLYFSLKDERAQIRCALFKGNRARLKLAPADGMQVLVRARISVYEPRGEYQLIIEQLEAAGEGALQRAFELLKTKLAAEGLFSAEHKKALPKFPERIGVITSASGAVIHDIITTFARRMPSISILLYPVPVQGTMAPAAIAAAIQLASKRKDCDALILARGGGSLEDLQAFNEEIVARAVYKCTIPIVSGIGHETDFTIADFVADARAATPTAAAEMLSADQNALKQQLQNAQLKLTRFMLGALREAQQSLDLHLARLIHPQQRIEGHLQRFNDLRSRLIRAHRLAKVSMQNTLLSLNARLQQCAPDDTVKILQSDCQRLNVILNKAMQLFIQHRQQQLHTFAGAINNLSPLATLGRGYAIVSKKQTGKILRSVNHARKADELEIRLQDGRLSATVNKTQKNN